MNIVSPAHLSFFAIYNPSITTDEANPDDQIVYSYVAPSKGSSASKKPLASVPDVPESPSTPQGDGDLPESNHTSRQQEKNASRNVLLRRIGLAQGMINFAGDFSNGEAINSIETEKARTCVREVEKGWWIIATINLTEIQHAEKPGESRRKSSGAAAPPATEPAKEYSTREVCPPALAMQQLVRAQSIFLLHHGESLSNLYIRLNRGQFCGILSRFWNSFLKSWDVFLHGNPAVDICNGIKLAAGGELGIGVGEEEWGSGEREVLENLISSTDGLVDMVVSRFGDDLRPQVALTLPKKPIREMEAEPLKPWLGCGAHPAPGDGVVFSGSGTLSKSSILGVSAWMEWIFRFGPGAYGVRENAQSSRRRRAEPRRPNIERAGSTFKSSESIKPTVAAETKPKKQSSSKADSRTDADSTPNTPAQSAYGTDTLLKYATLGLYGTSWGLPMGRPTTEPANNQTTKDGPKSPSKVTSPKKMGKIQQQYLDEIAAENGYFLIGLQGDLNSELPDMGPFRGTDEEGTENENDDEEGRNRRIFVRTIYCQQTQVSSRRDSKQTDTGHDRHSLATTLDNSKRSTRYRVVVYIRRPFIYTFLFDPNSSSPTVSGLYRSLHNSLVPLHRPLLASTNPAGVYTRLWDAISPRTISPIDNKQPLYDLVYDPMNLTVHTTIPNIPDFDIPSSAAVEPWSRIDSLALHTHILNIWSDTRRRYAELERTVKTAKGWWIVWMRLPHAKDAPVREAILVRKANDLNGSGIHGASAVARRAASTGTSTSSRLGSIGMGSMLSAMSFGMVGGSSTTEEAGSGRLAAGIGIDARRYVEGLLSLNR